MIAAEQRLTVREEATKLGLSERQVYRLRAMERRGEAEWRGMPGLDEDDLPYLSLTSDPANERGHWYDLESGCASVESGRVRVPDKKGTRIKVRPINGGSKRVEKIKNHQPDPSGLKGGVG